MTIMVILGPLPAWAGVFNHATHWRQHTPDKPCATCHQEGSDSIVPELKVCEGCHADQAFMAKVELPGLQTHGPTWGLNHAALARQAGLGNGKGQFDCENCHEQSDCLECHAVGPADEMGSFTNNMINVHRSEFAVSHPIAARTEPQRCTSCHGSQFCLDCHNAFAPEDLAIQSHRKSWSALPGPDDQAHASYADSLCTYCHENSVLPSHEWSGNHAREARKNLATCQACHPDGDICLRCHSAVTGLRINPHPDDWDNHSGRLERASGGRTCRKCH
jgi:hypothetical protein